MHWTEPKWLALQSFLQFHYFLEVLLIHGLKAILRRACEVFLRFAVVVREKGCTGREAHRRWMCCSVDFIVRGKESVFVSIRFKVLILIVLVWRCGADEIQVFNCFLWYCHWLATAPLATRCPVVHWRGSLNVVLFWVMMLLLLLLGCAITTANTGILLL